MTRIIDLNKLGIDKLTTLRDIFILAYIDKDQFITRETIMREVYNTYDNSSETKKLTSKSAANKAISRLRVILSQSNVVTTWLTYDEKLKGWHLAPNVLIGIQERFDKEATHDNY